MDGRFEGNTILVDLELGSPLVPEIKATHTFKVDTGFTNDVAITYKEAFPLALTLVGVQEYKIGDGTKVPFFECMGVVKFEDKRVVVPISIRPSGSLVIGVSLMKRLGIKLETDFVNNTVKFVKANANETPILAPKVPAKTVVRNSKKQSSS